MADATFQLQHRIEAPRWQRLQLRPLRGEGFDDDPLRGAMNTNVGDSFQPFDELGIELFQIPEGPPQEEVLADVAERALHLALRFRPVGPAGPRHEAVMARQRQ